MLILKTLSAAILISACNLVFAQQDTNMVIAYIEEVNDDDETWKAIHIEDSLFKLNSNVLKIRMRGPSLLKVRVSKCFSDNKVNEEIVVRVWTHMDAKQIFSVGKPFFLILAHLDSNGIYTSFRSYPVFKTWYGQWAKPFCEFKSEAFPEVKKPIFRNKLLRKADCIHYILIKDEIVVMENRKSLNRTLPN